ncbi:hypothetical protein [Streptomyces sp. NPDC127108]|uniref:hypothetical protein n=1 Tax=Streptomyces sp. NPDC127108 TaxID=3345361 RepID=UPI003626FAE4
METMRSEVRPAPTQPGLSDADRLAHDKATLVRRPRTVLYRSPAGGPHGSWPADEFAAARQAEGIPARVVMSMREDAFLVVVEGETGAGASRER